MDERTKKTIKEYKISINKGNERTYLDYEKIYFSDIAPYYGGKKKNVFSRNGIYETTDKTIHGIYYHLHLTGLVNAINKYSSKYVDRSLKKEDSLAILKLLVKGGTSTIHAYQSAPFLFFDIDVKNKEKKKENVELYKDAELNQRVFDFMSSISVLTFRSSSGKGMAGILYVPFLGDGFTKEKNREHIKIGKKINEYINSELDVPCQIEFDDAQNKFRQIRFIPPQKDQYGQAKKLKINSDYLEFQVEEYEKEVEVIDKAKSNKNILTRGTNNSNYDSKNAIDNYNKDVLCTDLLVGYYEPVNDNYESSRYNRIGGDSRALTVYHETNTYHDFTSKLEGRTPFDLLKHLEFRGNFKDALAHITKEGYGAEKTKKNVDSSSSNLYSHLVMLHYGGLMTDQQLKDAKFRIDNPVNELNPFDKEIKTEEYMREFGFRYPIEKLLKDKFITTTKNLKNDNDI